MSKATRRLAFVASGGSAPGLNYVLAAVVSNALRNGWSEVVGVQEAMSGLAVGKPRIQTYSSQDVVREIENSRAYVLGNLKPGTPTSGEMKTIAKSLKHLNVSGVISMGGDDSIRIWQQVLVAGRDCGLDPTIAFIPKTIDNDLDLPDGAVTLGFQTAAEEGARTVENLMADGGNLSRFNIYVAMGRTAGHLAGAVFAATSAQLLVTAEELGAEITLRDLALIIAGGILRVSLDSDYSTPYGVAVIGENVALCIRELRSAMQTGDNGNVLLHRLPLAQVIGDAVDEVLGELGCPFPKTGNDTMTKAVRGARPCAGDIVLARNLAQQAVDLVTHRETEQVVYVGSKGASSQALTSLINASGKFGTRVLDGRQLEAMRERQHRLRPADLQGGRLKKLAKRCPRKTPAQLAHIFSRTAEKFGNGYN